MPCQARKLTESSFHKHYYRHCPILDTEVSLHELYESSPILFWTIIIISSRWHPSLHELYAYFLDSYRALLARTLIEPQTSIEFVQAIVLLLFWPLAVNRQAEDPSWNLCGMVTNVAMKLAIHRLRANDRQGLSEKAAWIRRKTWLACVQANCRLASLLPPFLISVLTSHKSGLERRCGCFS